jgi:hypothetical protein
VADKPKSLKHGGENLWKWVSDAQRGSVRGISPKQEREGEMQGELPPDIQAYLPSTVYLTFA